MYILNAESQGKKVCQNNAELWEFCQTLLVVFGRSTQASPIFPATLPTNQDLIKLPSQTKRWLNWKNQPSLLPGRYVATARAAFESYPTYQDQFIVTPFHPGKRYTTCGFRSEAVSHDFAGFILIIAQLEVAALPESNIRKRPPFSFCKDHSRVSLFEGVW